MRTNSMRAILLHLGCNMWRKDDPVTGANKDEEERTRYLPAPPTAITSAPN